MDGRVSVSVQAADFDLAAEYARLAGDATIGAIVQFVGRAVRTLTLEHHPGMTEKVLQATVAPGALSNRPILSSAPAACPNATDDLA
jgi:molybdopterin synthase catalytic subunit